MQDQMKMNQLSQEETEAFLGKSLTGVLSTIDPDGAPYSVPVHFVFLSGALYFHGLPAGRKFSNLEKDSRVCFTAYEMRDILPTPSQKPCDTGTAYTSVVAQGTARILEKTEEKQQVLAAIVQKYTPQLDGREIPANRLNGTAVVKITITDITGKYHP